MSRSKKKEILEKGHQANGQLPPTNKVLDEILGGGDLGSKYKTLDTETYIRYINDMNSAELHAHARMVGLMPVDDTKRLKNALIEEFKSFAKTYRMPQSTAQLNREIYDKADAAKLPKEIRDILAEGA